MDGHQTNGHAAYDMGQKMSPRSTERKDWEKDKEIDPPGMLGGKHHDHARKRGKRPRARPGIMPNKLGTEQNCAVPKKENVTAASGKIPRVAEKYWGQHLWARGCSCATVGDVMEEIIRNYIANQGDDGKDEVFKVEE